MRGSKVGYSMVLRRGGEISGDPECSRFQQNPSRLGALGKKGWFVLFLSPLSGLGRAQAPFHGSCRRLLCASYSSAGSWCFLICQTWGMHRIMVGGFELTIFSDGTYPLDGGAFFGVIPKAMWSRKVDADERNYVTAGLNSLLIRTGQQTVLVETGMGNKLSDRMVKIYGQPAQLLTNLAAAGISPEDIDIVINSHLHFDHCG